MTKLSTPSISAATSDEMSTLFKTYGMIFAFSKDQFNKAKDPELEIKDYMSYGAGGYLPAKNLDPFQSDMETIVKKKAALIKEQYNKHDIIAYELRNHEAHITWDITDASDALEDFNYTQEEIQEVFNSLYK